MTFILPLPRQHVRMLLTALFYGGVAKVTGHIKVIYCYVPPWRVVLHIGVRLRL